MSAQARCAALRLLAIVDFDSTPERVALERWERLACAARPGTVAVDLRDRSRSARRLLELGTGLRDVARAAGQRFVVNDRLDLALLLGADGVHLGEASAATSEARQLLPGAFVLRACHAAGAAGAVDADGVLLSPVLAARKGNPALGLAALGSARHALVAAGSTARLFALGGVVPENAAACLAAGAHAVAAIGSALGTEDPGELLAALGIHA